MKLKTAWTAAMLVLAAAAVQAQAPNWRLYGNVGYSVGGDALSTGTYSTGATFNLNAGAGAMITLGLAYQLSEQLAIQASAGYHQEREVGTNGSIGFKRQPVELLAYVALTERARIGLGVRKALDAEVKGTGVAVGFTGTGRYESSVGGVLEAQYFFDTPSTTDRRALFGVNLRLVHETYTLQPGGVGPSSRKDGSHLALGLIAYY